MFNGNERLSNVKQTTNELNNVKTHEHTRDYKQMVSVMCTNGLGDARHGLSQAS